MTFPDAQKVDHRCPAVFMVVFLLVICLNALPASAQEVVDPSVVSALKRRLIGPCRGGRVTTVTGVADDPILNYLGATCGGVWKTENAGTT